MGGRRDGIEGATGGQILLDRQSKSEKPAKKLKWAHDLAEEFDSDHPSRRWLWSSTGEVFWQGIQDRERNMRHRQKEKRRPQRKDKIRRIKSRTRQKSLEKCIKPPPEAITEHNSSARLVDHLLQ
ncbi:hypothetical protein KSP40_PGU022798 [Platanthera guangdongensis]|uniref:Uncharacterized protein n=1 Tax=Platanthera guangdongensis TaxID=2320717 RepID=A0ABR2LI22_9ASPA